MITDCESSCKDSGKVSGSVRGGYMYVMAFSQDLVSRILYSEHPQRKRVREREGIE